MLQLGESAEPVASRLQVLASHAYPCADKHGRPPPDCAGWCAHVHPPLSGELGDDGVAETGVEPRRLAPGDLLGDDLHVVRWIGRGGTSDLYAAAQGQTRRLATIKLVRNDVADPQQARTHLVMEARALARINHPNVVALFGQGLFMGQPYLVVEYVRGVTLAATLRAMGSYPLPIRRVQSVVRGLVDGLAAAHDAGVLHGDISPANILISPDESVRLVDFGLARPLGAPCRSPSGALHGTPAYLAPELVARCEGRPAPTSDVYALACVVFELLTGRPPFVGDSVHSVLRQQVERPATLPTYLRPDLPPEIDRALLRALKKRPGTRTQTVAQLGEELAAGFARMGEQAERATSQCASELGL